MSVVIRELDPKRDAAWDQYVREQQDGTFFHLSPWRQVIERTFGHRTHYLLAEQGGSLSGVLPLVHLKSRLFGNRLISVPFCVYGGPLASDSESFQRLIDHAIDLMNRLDTDLIEFRTRDTGIAEWETRSGLYATFRKPITGDEAANLKAIPRKERAEVRKAMTKGLTSRIDRDAERFHHIYGLSVRNLGTPVFSRRYFRLLVECFRDCCDVLTILDKEEPLAAVLSFYFRDEVLPYYGGGSARARETSAHDFMYWELMRHAAAGGARLFDFGRSKFGTGSFAFKKNWGFTPEPLNYHYCLRAGSTIPDTNPLNPKYRLLISAWKKLPLPLANLIGPRVVRGIG